MARKRAVVSNKTDSVTAQTNVYSGKLSIRSGAGRLARSGSGGIPPVATADVDEAAVRKLLLGFDSQPFPTASISQLREGFDRSKIDKVAQMALLTKKEIAALLGVSERHLYNASVKPLTALQSEHLLSLEKLFSLGLLLFDANQEALSRWLRTPKQALALPQTGYPLTATKPHQQPTLAELFADTDRELTSKALERDMAYGQGSITEQRSAYPTPLSVLDTATGVRLVEAMLGRIQAGVFS